MGRIAQNYIYNVAYQLLIILTPIITAPYLTRVLGADNLGIYSYVNSSGSIITTISLLGIYAYGTRQTAYVRDDQNKLTQTFWELELVRFILGTIGTIIYFMYMRINKSYSFYFFLFFPYIIAQFLDCSWIYVGLEDMKPAVMKNFVTKLINVIGIFLFVRDKNDVWIYIFMLAITTLIANISIYTQLYKYILGPKEIKRIKWQILLNHIKGSFYLFLPQVASLFYLQVDKVMIEWFTGTTAQISFYDQAEKIINIPLALITVLSSVMMPRIANEFKKNNYAKIDALLLKSGQFSLLLAFPLMVGLFVISKQFIPWYLGEEYNPTTQAMMILAPIVLFNSLSSLSGAQYFTATNQIGILMRAYVSAAIINVIVNTFLIPKYGYVGAAIATVSSSFISVFVQYHYLTKQIKLRGLLKHGLIYAIGSLIMGSAIYCTTYKYESRIIITFGQILIGIISYFIYLCAVKDTLLWEFVNILKKKDK